MGSTMTVLHCRAYSLFADMFANVGSDGLSRGLCI